jgi:hypothetical protein
LVFATESGFFVAHFYFDHIDWSLIGEIYLRR